MMAMLFWRLVMALPLRKLRLLQASMQILNEAFMEVSEENLTDGYEEKD